MAAALPLRCTCGRMQGVVDVAAHGKTHRVVCYCDDCQAFARFLERTDVMDAPGGTDIYQVPPAYVRITEGSDEVRCVRLSERGLFRWYAGCCRTPIGNTVGARFPVVGLIHAFIAPDAEGRSRDEVLGEPLASLMGRFAIDGKRPPHVHPSIPPGFVARAAPRFLRWWIAGLARPSPFFDAKTGAPRVTPRVLTATERAALSNAAPRL